MKTLTELANKYNTDKGTTYKGPTAHGYTEAYEKLFAPMRDLPINLLEIGVIMEGTEGGHSLRLWYEYFPKANIYAFDICNAKRFENDRVMTFCGDESKRTDLEQMISKFCVGFNIIIDDASHIEEHQQTGFAMLFSILKPGGLYIIEDISIPNVKNTINLNNNSTYRMIEDMKVGYPKFGNYLNDCDCEYIRSNIGDAIMITDMNQQFVTAIIVKKK